jgi:hypothetical protein
MNQIVFPVRVINYTAAIFLLFFPIVYLCTGLSNREHKQGVQESIIGLKSYSYSRQYKANIYSYTICVQQYFFFFSFMPFTHLQKLNK